MEVSCVPVALLQGAVRLQRQPQRVREYPRVENPFEARTLQEAISKSVFCWAAFVPATVAHRRSGPPVQPHCRAAARQLCSLIPQKPCDLDCREPALIPPLPPVQPCIHHHIAREQRTHQRAQRPGWRRFACAVLQELSWRRVGHAPSLARAGDAPGLPAWRGTASEAASGRVAGRERAVACDVEKVEVVLAEGVAPEYLEVVETHAVDRLLEVAVLDDLVRGVRPLACLVCGEAPPEPRIH